MIYEISKLFLNKKNRNFKGKLTEILSFDFLILFY